LVRWYVYLNAWLALPATPLTRKRKIANLVEWELSKIKLDKHSVRSVLSLLVVQVQLSLQALVLPQIVRNAARLANSIAKKRNAVSTVVLVITKQPKGHSLVALARPV
jgi:hypothetical protein